mgnify:CR=1 FL=1
MRVALNGIKWKYDNAWSEIKRSLYKIMKGNDNACMHEMELRERKWKGNAKLIVEAWGGVKIRA